MTAKLFGSRAKGIPRPESDRDVLISDPELARAVPRPFFDEILDPRKCGPERFFNAAYQWSQIYLRAIGGNQRFETLKTAAKEQLEFSADNEHIDLFLHLPPVYGDMIWAVRMKLMPQPALAELWVPMLLKSLPLQMTNRHLSTAVSEINRLHKTPEIYGALYMQHLETIRSAVQFPTVPFEQLSFFSVTGTRRQASQ
jgi:hypothetical protein